MSRGGPRDQRRKLRRPEAQGRESTPTSDHDTVVSDAIGDIGSPLTRHEPTAGKTLSATANTLSDVQRPAAAFEGLAKHDGRAPRPGWLGEPGQVGRARHLALPEPGA